jgi:hypothetical protein
MDNIPCKTTNLHTHAYFTGKGILSLKKREIFSNFLCEKMSEMETSPPGHEGQGFGAAVHHRAAAGVSRAVTRRSFRAGRQHAGPGVPLIKLSVGRKVSGLIVLHIFFKATILHDIATHSSSPFDGMAETIPLDHAARASYFC